MEEHFNTYFSDFFKIGVGCSNNTEWYDDIPNGRLKVGNAETVTTEHNEKSPNLEECVFTDQLMGGQFADGFSTDIHASDIIDLDTFNAGASPRPNNAMKFVYNDNSTSGETCNWVSDSSLQSYVQNMFEQSDFETFMSSQSPGEALHRESFPSTSATEESLIITHANGGLALAVTENTSAPANITTAQDVAINGDGSLDQETVPMETSARDFIPKRTSTRTSKYRGVTKHRWTGRYEAHLWDNLFIREGHKRKGRQVYLGGYDTEEKAARAYDKAALKYWGDQSTTNFEKTNYEEEMEVMKRMTTVEYISHLKRRSAGFTRGASSYRGVTRHHAKGRWQARIGRINGNKDVYLGTYSTQEEAALTYDIATIKLRGPDAVTNFERRLYDVERIMSCSLPIGELIKYIKETGLGQADSNVGAPRIEQNNIMVSQRATASHINDVSESKTANERPHLCFEHQSNPLMAAPKLHSGLWHNPPDDIQTLGNVHYDLGQSMMTSYNHTVMQNMTGLGTASIRKTNNTGSAAATHTNLSDILEANGMLLSDSSVSFANSSGQSHATHFSSNSNGSEANEQVLPAYIRARDAAYLTPQQSTGPPTRVAYNNWMAAPLQALPPAPSLVPIFTPPFCNKWDFILRE